MANQMSRDLPDISRVNYSWWRHQMDTFTTLLAFVRGLWYPSQRPVIRSFGVSFDLRMKKQFSKQSRRRWFETPSRASWRHRNLSVSTPGASFTNRNKLNPRKTKEDNYSLMPWSWCMSNIYITLQRRHNEYEVSQITSVSLICSNVCSDADQRKHRSSASLAFVRGFPSQRASNAELFIFDDVAMVLRILLIIYILILINVC